MKYADIEGLERKDPFKKGFARLLKSSSLNLISSRIKIVPQSIGEPAALLDFLDYDFYLALKTDGVGTKNLIADTMAMIIRQGKGKINQSISSLYSGLGVDLVASNVNDCICLGATPLALTDEVAAGDYHTFLDQEFIKGLYAGLKKGCRQANITIPSGESPTLTDILRKNTVSITGSLVGIVKPKNSVVLGQRLKVGDVIYGLGSNGIHTNGLSLARKIIEKQPQGYFTPFGNKTIGEELLTPTKIYVKPVLAMLDQRIDVHYMSHISGSSFKKIMRAQQPFTYTIDRLPSKPKCLNYLQELENMPDVEAYETWNMGLGFVVFAPENEALKINAICQQYGTRCYQMGRVEKGPKQVVIKPLGITYKGGGLKLRN